MGLGLKLTVLLLSYGILLLQIHFDYRKPWSDKRTRLHKLAFGALIWLVLPSTILGSVAVIILDDRQAQQLARDASASRGEVQSTRRELAAAKEELARLIATGEANTTKAVDRLLGRVPPADRQLPRSDLGSALHRTLDARRTSYAVIALDGDQEAMRFAEQLSALLMKANWRMSTLSLALAEFQGPVEGIWVWAGSAQSEAAADRLVQSLRAHGLAAKRTTASAGMTPETSGGVTIVVGHNAAQITQTALPGMKSLSASTSLMRRP